MLHGQSVGRRGRLDLRQSKHDKQALMINVLSRLAHSLSRAKGSREKPAGSRFEAYDFSSERFECTLSSFSGTEACHDLFLNRYGHGEILELLERIGLMDCLHESGFTRPLLLIDRNPGHIHYLKLFDRREAPERLLIELRLSEMIYTPDERHIKGIIPKQTYKAIAVEWLSLQNPRLEFNRERPRLPGQNYPGLGAVRHMATLLETFAGDLMADAVLDVPEKFHAAVMYSGKFMFMDPAREGMMRAVLRDLGSHPLADLSWGFVTGTIRDMKTKKPVSFGPSEQLLPAADSLARYFTSREYRKRVEDEMSRIHLVLDEERMIQQRDIHPDYTDH